MRELKITFIGFGNVGREVARVFVDEKQRLQDAGLSPRVVAICTRTRGSIIDEHGIDLKSALASISRPSVGFPVKGTHALDIIANVETDVVLEMTSLDIFTGQPAISHAEAALFSGRHVVLANKGPVAWAFARLAKSAEAKGVRLLFEATVMDGTPVFSLVRHCLRGCRILGFEGVLNSTSNFVLERMARGGDAEEAVKEAQAQGFAEADPSLDLEGWDSVAKVAALANVLMSAGTNPTAVSRTGISGLIARDFARAARHGNVIKLVCRGSKDAEGAHLSVGPEEVPLAGLLATVTGTSSVLTLHTDLMGSLSLVEHSPSLTQTAYGVMADLIEIAREIY